jgi:hypothetical protein
VDLLTKRRGRAERRNRRAGCPRTTNPADGTLPVRSVSGYHHIHGEEEARGDECGSTHEEAGEGGAEKPKRGMPEDDKSGREPATAQLGERPGGSCSRKKPHSCHLLEDEVALQVDSRC